MTGQLSCRDPLRRAVGQLAPHCTDDRLDTLVTLVDEAMSGPARHYHHLPHALMVADSDDPLEIVIGLFHDIVQTHVEHGLPNRSAPYLHNIVELAPENRLRFLGGDLPTTDLRTKIVKSCFGFDDTDSLESAAGINEFLSALIAVEALGDLLNTEQLIALSIGIEATIPFRKQRASENHFYFKKIKSIANQFDIDISDNHILQHAERAIRIANRDVRSFGENNLRSFLDETWDLMLESSPQLGSSASSDISSYRKTLQNMTRFLSSLKADLIFQKEGRQSDVIFTEHLSKTTYNLKTISCTMQTKLLATALIESSREGGCTRFRPVHRRLSAATNEATTPTDIFSLLCAGSDAQIEFDIGHSPLSWRLVESLTMEEIQTYAMQVDLDSGLAIDRLEALPNDIRSKARELARTMLF